MAKGGQFSRILQYAALSFCQETILRFVEGNISDSTLQFDYTFLFCHFFKI